jgi:GNAT superfamily N-acetyltransferase
MSEIEKTLSVYLRKTFGDRFVVYCINPIGDHRRDLKQRVYAGCIDARGSGVPRPLGEFLDDFSSYNIGVPEATSVTERILDCPIYLLVERDGDGRERYVGAVHSIQVKRNNNNDVSNGYVGEVKVRINVRKSERGKGRGKMLLDVLEKRYLSRGYTLICEFSKKNEGAIKFFEKNGFEIEDADIYYRAVKRPQRQEN